MANYIMDLRKFVGKSPLFMPAAGVLITNDKNQLLLERRTDNDMWSTIGGAMELGETLEETARREVKEEVGLTLGKLELFKIYSGEDLHHIYPNGDEVYIISTMYTTNEFTGEVAIDENEVKDLKFFDMDNLPENIHKPDRLAIQEFVDRYKKV